MNVNSNNNPSAVIDKVAEAMEERRRVAAADFAALVESIAKGKDVAPAKVEDVLQRSGKTVEDLRGAIAARERRARLRATFDRLPKLREEAAQLDAKLAAENEILEAAQRRHGEACAPLLERAEALHAEIRSAESAGDELVNNCPHEAVLRELAEVEQTIAILNRETLSAEYVAEVRRQAYAELAAAKRQLEDEPAQQLRASGEAKLKEAEEAEARMPGLRKRIKELQGRAETLRQQRIAP